MTSHEVYIALFWFVIGGYVVYVGWTLHRIAAERTARAHHPSSLPQLAGGAAEVRGRGGAVYGPQLAGGDAEVRGRGGSGGDRDPSAGASSLVELLFD
jgi:hypothetical protein